MKTMEEWRNRPAHSQTRRCMEVASRPIHYIPGERSPGTYSLLGWGLQSRYGRCGVETFSYLCREMNFGFSAVHRLLRCYTDWATPAPLILIVYCISYVPQTMDIAHRKVDVMNQQFAETVGVSLYIVYISTVYPTGKVVSFHRKEYHK
jgi:hypothetical protein